MSPRRSPDPRRVLRWYPAAWRRQHGAVLLATLEELAEDRGGPALSRREAWSMRVHGAAERLSVRMGAALTLAGAVVAVLGTVGLVTGAGVGGPVATVVGVLGFGLAPALLAWSAAALGRDLGLLGPAGTVVAVLASAAACTLAPLVVLSWGDGFRAADAGLPPGALARALPALVVAALVAGAVAAAVVLGGALRAAGLRAGGAALRWGLAAVLAVPAAVAVGVASLQPGATLLTAAVLGGALLVREQTEERRRAANAAAVAPPPSGPTPGPDARTIAPVRTRRRALVVPALVSAVAGAPFLVLAASGGDEPLAGSPLPLGLAGLPAMNLALTGGAFASLPLVLAVGRWAADRWRAAGAAAGVLVTVAVLASAVSAAMGPVGDAQLLLLAVAAVLVGVAVLLPVAHRVPGPAVTWWLVVGVGGVSLGLSVALHALAVLPLAAPFVALLVAVLTARRPRRGADERRSCLRTSPA